MIILLVSPLVLDYQSFSNAKKFILKCDASDIAVAVVLSKKNNHYPMAFARRGLSPVLSYQSKDLLAIVFGGKRFWLYPCSRKSKTFTDHKPIVYFVKRQ